MEEAKAVAGSAPDKPVEIPEIKPGKVSLSDQIKAEVEKLKAPAEKAVEAAPAKEEAEEVDPEKAKLSDAAEEVEEDDDEVLPSDSDRFKKRVDRLNQKVEKATLDRQSAQNEVLDLKDQLEAANKRIADASTQLAVVADFEAVCKIDPALKQLVEDHWFFKGKPPTLDDFSGDTESYQKMLSMIAERQVADRAKASEKSPEPSGKSVADIQAALDSKEKELATHPVFKAFMSESDLNEVYNFMTAQARSGNTYFDTLEKAIPVVLRERYEKQLRRVGAEEAVARMDKARKGSAVTGKTAAPAQAKPDFRKMSTMEQAKYWTSQIGA